MGRSNVTHTVCGCFWEVLSANEQKTNPAELGRSIASNASCFSSVGLHHVSNMF